MFTKTVESSSGKMVKITLFPNFVLILSLPYLILNGLNYFVLAPILYFSRILLLFPSKCFVVILHKLHLFKVEALIIFSMLVIPSIFLIQYFNLVGGYMEYVLFAIFWVTSGAAVICLENYSQFFAKTLNEEMCQKYIYSVTQKIGSKLPKGLHINDKTVGILIASFMVTIYVVYCLCLMVLITSDAGWLYWGLCILVFSFSMSLDFEQLEHIASHSPKGKLFRVSRSGIREYIYVSINWLRRYVVWNLLAFWQADKYYYTHTLHHHVENNGPADWQSTLRFDQTSFFDFSKAVLWFGLSNMVPFETWRYLKSLGKHRQAKDLLISQLKSYLVYLCLLVAIPSLTLVLFFMTFANGVFIYIFVHRWHGFHDNTRPYDVIASNNNREHFAHHKKPGVHIFDMPALQEIFDRVDKEKSDEFRVHKFQIWWNLPRFEFDLLLVRYLLWQNKVECLKNILLNVDHDDDSRLHQYVIGSQLIPKSAMLTKIDARVSHFMGRLGESILKPVTSPQTISVCYDLNEYSKQ